MRSPSRVVAVVALLLPLASACAGPPTAPTRAADEAALRALWGAFEQAFNAGDAQAVAAHYAPDADRIGTDGVREQGRAAIAAGYAELLSRRAADPTRAPFRADLAIRWLHPDVALLDGTWAGSRDGQPVRGQFTLAAVRRGDRWLLAAGRDRGLITP